MIEATDRKLMRLCAVWLWLALLTPLSFAQTSPGSATRAQSTEAAAHLNQAGLVRACAGAARELEASRALIEAQRREAELANQRAELEAQRAQLAEEKARLAEERAVLKDVALAAERERAEKLAEAERIQAQRAEKAEARVKRLSGVVKWSAVAGFVGGLLAGGRR